MDENHGWVGGWGDATFQRRSSSETIDSGNTWRDANEIGKAINRFRFFGHPVTVAGTSYVALGTPLAHGSPPGLVLYVFYPESLWQDALW